MLVGRRQKVKKNILSEKIVFELSSFLHPLRSQEIFFDFQELWWFARVSEKEKFRNWQKGKKITFFLKITWQVNRLNRLLSVLKRDGSDISRWIFWCRNFNLVEYWTIKPILHGMVLCWHLKLFDCWMSLCEFFVSSFMIDLKENNGGILKKFWRKFLMTQKNFCFSPFLNF